MAKSKVGRNERNTFDSDQSENASEESYDENWESEIDSVADNNGEDGEKSGMANVVARILSKDISKSNRILLAKGKTNKEILRDISERKRQREESGDVKASGKRKVLKLENKESNFFKEEKRKAWESMGRKIPSVLDNPKEMKLRKLATQGMVQLFRSVNEHQKLMKDRLSSVGSSERKKDKVMAEFTKGKFLDLLKGRKKPEEQKGKESESKWKILQDDYMMGANIKDWDRKSDDEDSEEAGDNGDQSADVDMSDDD